MAAASTVKKSRSEEIPDPFEALPEEEAFRSERLPERRLPDPLFFDLLLFCGLRPEGRLFCEDVLLELLDADFLFVAMNHLLKAAPYRRRKYKTTEATPTMAQ